MGKGGESIIPSRHHVVSHERRLSPMGRIPTNKEEIARSIAEGLALNE